MASLFVSVKTLILLFGSLFSLSPVLRTLTNSFSDDTITACTVLLLLAHLFFHDYGYVNGDLRQYVEFSWRFLHISTVVLWGQ